MLWLGKGKVMPKQAKVLSSSEIRKVLDYVATRKHSLRNRALVLTMFNTGMRVSEVASLRIKDVVDNEGNIKNEIRLAAVNTKTNDWANIEISERTITDSVEIGGIEYRREVIPVRVSTFAK